MSGRYSVGVDARTVQIGDVVVVGGISMVVADLVMVSRGGRQLVFASGDALTIGPRTTLMATRATAHDTRGYRWAG